jgi:hypothetical protein
MTSVLTLVKTRIYSHVSLDQIHEFETVIREHPNWDTLAGPPSIPALKIVARLIFWFAKILGPLLRLLPVHWRARDYLCVGYLAPHYVLYKTFPYFCIPAGLRILWMYDAWEKDYANIEALIRNHKINLAFITSLQTTQHFNALKLEDFRAYWSPEAITVSGYKQKPARERSIDVIQIGRKWDAYHEVIEPFCRAKDLTYLYEKIVGQIIFSSREEYLCGLADSKISICVPASVTHPGRSGKISTMTWRYLQSMASKCLILGILPGEMKLLFDYNPIVEIDMSRPCEQLHEILRTYDSYIDLIERNYLYIAANHQWANRLDTMMEQINQFKQIRQSEVSL